MENGLNSHFMDYKINVIAAILMKSLLKTKSSDKQFSRHSIQRISFYQNPIQKYLQFS